VAHQQHIGWQVVQMELAIAFNQSRGAFQETESATAVQQLARLFWLVIDLWMYRQSVLQASIDDFSQFRNTCWALFKPYFTDMGEREFEQLNARNSLPTV
jgi:hypothetical protein